jgi:M6 family metalloprotease-like protein
MSLRFNGREFTFTQPDETQIQVRGWGNQFYATFETLDGFTIIQNPDTGFYEYAKLTDDSNRLEPTGINVGLPIPPALNLIPKLRINPEAAKQQALEASEANSGRRCEIRRQEVKSVHLTPPAAGMPLPAPPTETRTGTYTGLCLLIEFPEDRGSIPQAEIEKFCNQRGYRGFGNNGSVFDYFYDNSQGKLQYTNIVTPYYMAQNNKNYYTDRSIEYPERARELIGEALNYFQAEGFDFSDLSVDSSNHIFALNVFYAGSIDNIRIEWSKGLWPHAWNLASPFITSSGKQFYDYQITNIGNDLSLGTFCHENGHMLCDFPDLYDYGYESSGIGSYCLMCSEGNPKNPVHISAYLKYKAGWASSVQQIVSGTRVDIAAGINDFFIHKNSNNAAEYFIIENRQAIGRDSSIPSEGLAIWHIDERGSNNNEQMTSSQHYECSLEQADGRFDLENINRNNGDTEDLFSASRNRRFGENTIPNSKWWNGTSSGLEITNISLPGQSMTLQIPPRTGGVYQLTALADTIIKRSTAPSQDLPADRKFSLSAGQIIDLTSYRPAANNHWKIELSSPQNGVSKWFAFRPHVKVE